MASFTGASLTISFRTDKKIAVLMAYIVNTGLLTSICALIVLITVSPKWRDSEFQPDALFSTLRCPITIFSSRSSRVIQHVSPRSTLLSVQSIDSLFGSIFQRSACHAECPRKAQHLILARFGIRQERGGADVQSSTLQSGWDWERWHRKYAVYRRD